MTEAAATTVSTGAGEENVSYVGTDYTLKEGWVDNLVPEDVRNESVFKDLAKNPETKVNDVMKMLGGLQKVIGKKGIIPPTDSSTQTEWDNYYRAIGRPDKAESYNLSYPKDLNEYVPEEAEVKKAFMEHSYKLGKTQKQTAADYDFINNLIKTSFDKQAKQYQEEVEKSENFMRTKSGSKFDEDLHVATKTIEEGMQGLSDEEKKDFLETINNNSMKHYVYYILSRIGRKFQESPGIPNEAGRNIVMTPSEAKAKMDEIAKTLADTTLVYNNPGLQQRLTREMEGLAKLISLNK